MVQGQEDANKYLKQKFQAFRFGTFHIEHPWEYRRINQSNFQLSTRWMSFRGKKAQLLLKMIIFKGIEFLLIWIS